MAHQAGLPYDQAEDFIPERAQRDTAEERLSVDTGGCMRDHANPEKTGAGAGEMAQR